MEIGGTSWLEQASDQRGSVFIAGLVMATVLTMLGGALFSFALSDTYLTSGTMNDARALYAAEIGLNQALLAYATGARVWPTTADTSFTDKPLTYGSQAARFTVTATPVNPTTLLVVSTGCYPKSAGGSCPDRSGFAKIQDTVQKQDTTATSNVGFPYVLAGGTGQVGGQSAAVNGDVYFNGDISQLNGTCPERPPPLREASWAEGNRMSEATPPRQAPSPP